MVTRDGNVKARLPDARRAKGQALRHSEEAGQESVRWSEEGTERTTQYQKTIPHISHRREKRRVAVVKMRAIRSTMQLVDEAVGLPDVTKAASKLSTVNDLGVSAALFRLTIFTLRAFIALLSRSLRRVGGYLSCLLPRSSRALETPSKYRTDSMGSTPEVSRAGSSRRRTQCRLLHHVSFLERGVLGGRLAAARRTPPRGGAETNEGNRIREVGHNKREATIPAKSHRPCRETQPW